MQQIQAVQEAPAPRPAKEAPELYALCRDERLMPCVFVRWQEGAEIVRPVNSQREYSFNPDRILSVADGEKILMARKIEGVIENYTFTELTPAGSAARAVLCSHPRDNARSYVLSLAPAGWLCTCHAFSNSLFSSCKHTAALYELEHPGCHSSSAAHMTAAQVYSSLMHQPRPAAQVAPVSAEDW